MNTQRIECILSLAKDWHAAAGHPSPELRAEWRTLFVPNTPESSENRAIFYGEVHRLERSIRPPTGPMACEPFAPGEDALRAISDDMEDEDIPQFIRDHKTAAESAFSARYLRNLQLRKDAEARLSRVRENSVVLDGIAIRRDIHGVWRDEAGYRYPRLAPLPPLRAPWQPVTPPWDPPLWLVSLIGVAAVLSIVAAVVTIVNGGVVQG